MKSTYKQHSLVSLLAATIAVGWLGLSLAGGRLSAAGPDKPDAIPAAELGATKTYPPYPEVWGYGYELEFPVPEDRRVFDVWKMDNGDYLFIYTKSEQIARKDGSCCGFRYTDESLQFFSGVRKAITRREIDQLRSKYQSISSETYQKLTFSDGSSIERGGVGGSSYCYTSFPYHIVKKDQSGKVIARKSGLYLRERRKQQPLNPRCEDSAGWKYFGQSVGEIGYRFLPLGDDTFVVHGGEGNFIRFDKDFNTRYRLNDQVFLIDTRILEELIKQSADERWKETKLKGNVSNARIIDDLVGNHLRKLRGAAYEEQELSPFQSLFQRWTMAQPFMGEVKAIRAKNRTGTVGIDDLVAKYVPVGTRKEAALKFCKANGLKISPVRDKRNFRVDPKTYDEAIVCGKDMMKAWYLFWAWWAMHDTVVVTMGIKDGVVVWAGGAIHSTSL